MTINGSRGLIRAEAPVEPTTRNQHYDALELARAHLRRHANASALDALRGAGDDEMGRLARAYTHRRLDGAPPLTAAEHERVVRWLTREELAAAEEALDAHRFAEALVACEAAQRIDDRGARCARLLATTMRLRVVQAVADGSDELDKMRQHLTAARDWLRRAPDAPDERAASAREARAIDGLLAHLDEAVAERRWWHEVDALVTRYQAVLRIHGEPSTLVGLGVFRSSVASIRTDAELLRRRLPPGSIAQRRLAELLLAITRQQSKFR